MADNINDKETTIPDIIYKDPHKKMFWHEVIKILIALAIGISIGLYIN